MASVSMVMTQKGSRGPTGTRPVLPALGQWGDPGGKVEAGPDDHKDFVFAIAAEGSNAHSEPQGKVKVKQTNKNTAIRD